MAVVPAAVCILLYTYSASRDGGRVRGTAAVKRSEREGLVVVYKRALVCGVGDCGASAER